jgi:hypothetical protein
LCRVLTATAFLVPVLLISSCDDKNSTPVGPSDDPATTDLASPSFTTVGFGSKWHDPHLKGPKVRTFTNNYLAQVSPNVACDAAEKRFGSQDGAELRVTASLIGIGSTEITSEEDICDAGVYPVDQKIRGKQIGQVKELDFSYAGGGEFGGPTMRIPIDECLEVSPDVSTASTPSRQPCGDISFQFTDGIMEEYAYISAETCNDGDANVGTVAGEDTDECVVRYSGTEYPNWPAFVEAHPDYRVAKKARDLSVLLPLSTAEELPLVDARTSVVISPFLNPRAAEVPSLSSHYLVWMVDVR